MFSGVGRLNGLSSVQPRRLLIVPLGKSKNNRLVGVAVAALVR